MQTFNKKTNVFLRIAGLIAGGYCGILLGIEVAERFQLTTLWKHVSIGGGAVLLGLIGLLLLLPLVRALYQRISKYSSADIVSTTAGLIVGLLLALLIASLFDGNPFFKGLLYVLCAVLGAMLGHKKLSKYLQRKREAGQEKRTADCSALIDGRIYDVCVAGFIQGELFISSAAITYLQTLAGQQDTVKRARGKRGLEIINQLKELPSLTVTVVPSTEKDTDLATVELAKKESCPIISVDCAIAKAASVAGIRVLNVNELASALRPSLLVGEAFYLLIVKTGKEPWQGVGYLDDGTMVVIENGGERVGDTVHAEVTTVMQTNAGRLIFARIPENE